MQQQNNNNKLSRSSGSNTSSSSTRIFSNPRSSSNASSTTRIFSNPPPVVSQQQGARSSTSSSTPVVFQQQKHHPISIDLSTTSITQLPDHLIKLLSKKTAKTVVSPVAEHNNNAISGIIDSTGITIVQDSKIVEVSPKPSRPVEPEIDFASIMSSPADLLLDEFLRTPPRQITLPEPDAPKRNTEHSLDIKDILSDLSDHDGFGNEHLDTYLPNYFHDMPTTWEQPEEIPEPDMSHLVTINIQPDILLSVTPPPAPVIKPVEPEDKQENCSLFNLDMPPQANPPSLTNSVFCECLKCVHDAYLYSNKGISVTIEENFLELHLGLGSLADQRKKIETHVRNLTDKKFKNLEEFFTKKYQKDLLQYGEEIKDLVQKFNQQEPKETKPKKKKPSAKPQRASKEPVLSQIPEELNLSSEEQIIEITPPPVPKPVELPPHILAKILVNKCRESSRLPPLNLPEEFTIDQLQEQIQLETNILDEKIEELEKQQDQLLEQQEEPEEKQEELIETPEIPPAPKLSPIEPEVLQQDVDVKLPESDEDEQDDDDPISEDRKTQLVQVFARYGKIPTDVFLILIDYVLSIEDYAEAAAVVKAHHRLLETEIPYCLKHMSRVFLNYFDHFYQVKEIPSNQCKTDDYNLLVMMRDNIYKMQERRYRYATSHRPMIDYLIGKPARVQELKGIIDAEHSQLNLANQMAIENMPEEYADVNVEVWQHKSQNVTALHELGSPEYVPQNEREQKFQEQLQNSKAVQSRNKKKQKRNQKLADLHAAAEPKDPKRDPDTDASAVCVQSLPEPDGTTVNFNFVGGSSKGYTGQIDELGLKPRGNQRVDFSFRPTTSIFSAAQLRQYKKRGQVATQAAIYKGPTLHEALGVEIEEPIQQQQQTTFSKSRKSKKIRPDIYAPRLPENIPAVPTYMLTPAQLEEIEISNPLEPLEADVQFLPEIIPSSNKRQKKSKDKYKEIAQFDEEGDVILIEPKKKGRPSKPKHLHKYQKKQSKRGRPKKQPAPVQGVNELGQPIEKRLADIPEEAFSPPWTPAVLPVHQWYSPTGFLQGIPEPKPVDPYVTQTYAQLHQNTFNDEVQEHFIEPPNRPPKYNWEDRRHWERKRVVQDYENDFKTRFRSTGLQPMAVEQVYVPLLPPPAPVLRPVEPMIHRERTIPIEPPTVPVHMLPPEQIAAIPVEEELQPLEPLEDFNPFEEELKAFAEEEIIPLELPKRKRGRPRKYRPEIRIGKRSFLRRQRQVEEQLRARAEKIRNQAESNNLYLLGRQLNVPYLSNQLRRVYKRSIELNPGIFYRDTSFVFDYDQGNFALATGLGPQLNLLRQLEFMDEFIARTTRRAVSRWRVLVHYSGPNGDRIISTTALPRSNMAFDRIGDAVDKLIFQYGEEEIHITGFEIRVVNTDQALFGGMSAKELNAKLDEIKEKYVVINPNSKSNCLWTSISIANQFEIKPEILNDTKKQNEAGKYLKKVVGTRNERGGNEEDIDKCCNHIGRMIIVYDNFNSILGTFIPDELKRAEPIHLLLMNGHYHALVPKTNPTVQEYALEKNNEIKDVRSCQPIPKKHKEPEVRRIVVYDLESYKNPKTITKADGTTEEEIHQVAYACAWAFEIEGKEEEKTCQDLNYQIITYPYLGKDMTVAYKRILGETCLDESLEQWMYQVMFKNAVFYAHNGGKFDIRLILGQSNLMYKEAYVIDSSRTIELNSRIINLDIQNITLEYTEEKINKSGVAYELKKFHTISLRDSLALFGPGSSLAKLCKEMNVPHQKLKEQINVHDLQYEDTWQLNWYGYDMDKYLLHDVLGLLEVMIQFNQKVMEGTTIPITSVNTGASLSKKFFLKHHYHNQFHEDDDKQDPTKTIYTLDFNTDKFIREGYGGGRCEAFVSKEHVGPCYYYDFTSLYPDVGRQHMPVGKPNWIVEENEIKENEIHRTVQYTWNKRINQRRTLDQLAFWKVKVRSPLAASGQPTDPNIRKPLFGLKEAGMYLFRWYTNWTEMVIFEPELLYAIDQGLDYEFEPINGIIFESNPLLKGCMEELFQKKAEATERNEEALAKTWKIIINSLYGVWGLKIVDREGIEIARPEKSNWAIDMVTDKLMDIEKVGKYIVTRRLKDLEVQDCNVAIAAAVTAYARIKLYSIICDVQDAGGQILYCDTDSIITNYCLETDLVLKNKWIGPSDGKDLGSLKNEIDKCYEKYPHLPKTTYFDQAVIVAPKLYIITAANGLIVKKAHKGYREDESKGDIVTYERMKKLIDPNEPTEERLMIQTTNQWLGGNRDLLKNNIGVRIVERRKQLKQTVNKGNLNEIGLIVPYISTPEKAKRK